MVSICSPKRLLMLNGKMQNNTLYRQNEKKNEVQGPLGPDGFYRKVALFKIK